MAQRRSSPGTGPSQRQLRVGELIRRTLSETLSRQEIHDPDLNRMSITVGEVRVSPDLRIATVYALPLGGQGKDEAIAALKRNNHELRRAVARNVLLKNVPELRYQADDTFDRLDETRRLFSDETVQRDIKAPGDSADPPGD
ncbi:MAG: 30S ribosome-binding factor RbfA [Rhodobacter sp.]|jgi:ribosome-binding factor A|nr:30S ribosome-binding factor RbfA [Rhodobacter sp.]MCA3493383.1 30S ribosome-binding factor RbfA [Rhodobacter sp.]MCA3498998.1 30S ribosome-binding factor RbfA [Rhodobacter sp.]MCA3502869.1 30S ribosome-binding factor RbfA [Rhodobacter sp.]MCA3515770.1 30S ribosome-binding factor RbfA [Rhodobacter sp.]